jgi:hypothetical protein
MRGKMKSTRSIIEVIEWTSIITVRKEGVQPQIEDMRSKQGPWEVSAVQAFNGNRYGTKLIVISERH